MVKQMYSPLIVDPKDPKWFLLQQILTLVSSRRTKQEFSKRGINPVGPAEESIKIVLVAMFFSVDCAFVVQEMQDRRKLRRFMGITEVPSIDTIYRFLSKWDEIQFVSLISGILNSCRAPRRKR